MTKICLISVQSCCIYGIYLLNCLFMKLHNVKYLPDRIFEQRNQNNYRILSSLYKLIRKVSLFAIWYDLWIPAATRLRVRVSWLWHYPTVNKPVSKMLKLCLYYKIKYVIYVINYCGLLRYVFKVLKIFIWLATMNIYLDLKTFHLPFYCLDFLDFL